MKKIIYTNQDGSLAILTPVEGARLARFVTLADGTQIPPAPPYVDQPVDHIMRRWPIEGATADWSETEAEFVTRIKLKDVPAAFLESAQEVDDTVFPSDRSRRSAWRQNGASVVIDAIAAAAIDLKAMRIAAVNAEAVADNFIDKLRDATPADIKQFVQNNITDLASARLFIGKLACAVSFALNGGKAK